MYIWITTEVHHLVQCVKPLREVARVRELACQLRGGDKGRVGVGVGA